MLGHRYDRKLRRHGFRAFVNRDGMDTFITVFRICDRALTNYDLKRVGRFNSYKEAYINLVK